MKPIAAQTRAAILRTLERDGPDLSRRQIADMIGVSEVCVRRWLHRLVEEGEVHISSYAVPPLGGKPAALFTLGPEPTDLRRTKPKQAKPAQAHVVLRELRHRRLEATAARVRPRCGPPQPHYLMAALYGIGANA